MDDKNKKREETYIEILQTAQDKLTGIVLPSMGLLNNEVKVEIKGSEFLNQKKDGKESSYVE